MEVLDSKDISQESLAEGVGMSQDTITSICANRSQPHLKDLRKMALFLDVDIRELLISTKRKTRPTTGYNF